MRPKHMTWERWIGAPFALMNCYEVTRKVCNDLGRWIPKIDETTLREWHHGDALPSCYWEHIEEVSEHDAQPGDVLLLRDPRCTAGAGDTVTQLAPVVDRGAVLMTVLHGKARVATIRSLRHRIVRVCRPPLIEVETS